MNKSLFLSAGLTALGLLSVPVPAQTPPQLRAFVVPTDSNQNCTGGDQKLTFYGSTPITQTTIPSGNGYNNWPTADGTPLSQGGVPTNFWVRKVGVNLFVNGNSPGQIHIFVGHGSPNNNANGDELTPMYVTGMTLDSTAINVPVVDYPSDGAELFVNATDYFDLHIACPTGDQINGAWLTVWWVPAP